MDFQALNSALYGKPMECSSVAGYLTQVSDLGTRYQMVENMCAIKLCESSPFETSKSLSKDELQDPKLQPTGPPAPCCC